MSTALRLKCCCGCSLDVVSWDITITLAGIVGCSGCVASVGVPGFFANVPDAFNGTYTGNVPANALGGALIFTETTNLITLWSGAACTGTPSNNPPGELFVVLVCDSVTRKFQVTVSADGGISNYRYFYYQGFPTPTSFSPTTYTLDNTPTASVRFFCAAQQTVGTATLSIVPVY